MNHPLLKDRARVVCEVCGRIMWAKVGRYNCPGCGKIFRVRKEDINEQS